MIISSEKEIIIRTLLPHAKKSCDRNMILSAKGIRIADLEDIQHLIVSAILDMFGFPPQDAAFDRSPYEWDFRLFINGRIGIDETIERFKIRILSWE